MDGRDRPILPGVHGLEHVQSFATADLTDDDSIGAHAKGIPDQVPDRYLAFPLDVGRAVLQTDYVRLL